MIATVMARPPRRRCPARARWPGCSGAVGDVIPGAPGVPAAGPSHPAEGSGSGAAPQAPAGDCERGDCERGDCERGDCGGGDCRHQLSGTSETREGPGGACDGPGGPANEAGGNDQSAAAVGGWDCGTWDCGKASASAAAADAGSGSRLVGPEWGRADSSVAGRMTGSTGSAPGPVC